MAEIKAIVTRWKWGDVEELIDARKFPGALLNQMHADAQRACSELTKHIATLEEHQRTLKRQIKEAKQHRAHLGELQSEARSMVRSRRCCTLTTSVSGTSAKRRRCSRKRHRTGSNRWTLIAVMR